MTTASISPGEKPSLSELVAMKKRKGFRSATQLLWDKLESNASLYLLSARRPNLTAQEDDILEQCRAKLELARSNLDRFTKRPFSIWELLHEVDGLLLLVLPEEMLPSRGLEILQRFKRKITDEIQRDLWLGKDQESGPLPRAVQLLTQGGIPSEPAAPALMPAQLSRCRYTLRGALGVLNEQVDQGFWQLSINVAIQLLSGLLIIALILVSLGISDSLRVVDVGSSHVNEDALRRASWLAAITFSIFGIIGATLSNMLSKERFVVATGATARYFAYHLFLKPLIGGFAALFVFLVEQSHLLMQIVVAAGGVEQPFTSSVIQFNVNNNHQAFLLRAALGLVAGFFADRVLSSMMDRVLGRILKESEKTTPRLPRGEQPE